MSDQKTVRPLSVIAAEINRTWPNVYFAAKPYLRAMFALNTIDDDYGYEDGKSVVNYFLSNATTWRGDDARRIKAELKALVK
jgi:hypothetical protein